MSARFPQRTHSHSHFSSRALLLTFLCPHSFIFITFYQQALKPADANSAGLVMKDVEVVVVEVVRVFITRKGFGGPTEDWSRNGEAAERAALP